MRLNGWQRIGVVLSVVWVTSAAVYERNRQLDMGKHHAETMYRLCVDLKRGDECGKELTANTQRALFPHWENVAALSLIPIPLAWIIAYLFVGVYRWVRAGFHSRT